jgi:DNA-binding response OmpR family regulator
MKPGVLWRQFERLVGRDQQPGGNHDRPAYHAIGQDAIEPAIIVADSVPPTASPLKSDPSESRSKLLVVDDEQAVRTTMAASLGLMGYDVEQACNGEEALGVLQRGPRDLVVMDLCMPGMDGVELMQRARQIQPDLSIIVLTGHATVESAITAVRTEADDYLLKPIKIQELAAVISQALEKRNSRSSQSSENPKDELVTAINVALEMLREKPAPEVAQTPAPSLCGDVIQAGSVTLDCRKRFAVVAGVDGHPVELTEGESALLEVLIKSPNVVFSCRELARDGMGYDLDKWEAQSLVRPCIHRLRKKIEIAPDAPELICTVRGRGYYFSVNPI